MSNDEPGYSLGSRTKRPHHPDGWFPGRKDSTESKVNTTKRGTLKSGQHDRSEKES